MNKYGIENFKIECIEEVSDPSILSEREIYWIQELQTYGRSGYNATKGGDGAMFYDPSEVVTLYNLGYSLAQVAKKLNCGRDTVSRILKAKGIQSRSCNKEIEQYDKAGNYIQTFSSATLAAQWILDYIDNLKKHNIVKTCICRCAKDFGKSAYGYKWKYVK